MAIGMDKHLPGAFAADPVQYGVPSWYGETGLFLTPKFFAMKIQRYMYDHGISPRTLARVAAKNYRNGGAQPQRLPAPAAQRGRDPRRRRWSTTR